mmetsp:Transcript_79781/g.227698  ORF Transcript_79781/g.227698 Transcript_79781/m.227698 type:complete len:94 (+) Transcript_79781:177-458(+)
MAAMASAKPAVRLDASGCPVEDSDSESDGEGFMVPGMFTKGLDIEDDFDYCFGDDAPDAVTISIRGISRDLGQTAAVGNTGDTIWRGAEELCR